MADGPADTGMRFGVKLPQTGADLDPDAILDVARRAESSGYGFVSVGDHIVLAERPISAYPYAADGRHPAQGTANYVEALTMLSWVAGATRSIGLLTGILVAPYRHPILSAKMLASLDFLTRGRVMVGVGVGWLKEEFEALGVDYERRGPLTDETIAVWKALWRTDPASYRGDLYNLDGLRFSPTPVQTPHPRVWIGGSTVTALRRVVSAGDGWMPVNLSPDELAPAVADLRRRADEAGRDPDSIDICLDVGLSFPGYTVSEEFSRRLLGGGEPGQMAEEVEKLRELGVRFLHFEFPTRDVGARIELMERFMRDVRPQVT